MRKHDLHGMKAQSCTNNTVYRNPSPFSLLLYLADVFLSITFALMVGSLLETVVITNIQFSSNKHSMVPHWLRVLMLQYLAVIVCLPPKKPNSQVTVFINPSTGGIIFIIIIVDFSFSFRLISAS